MAGGWAKSGLPKSALTAQLTFCGKMLGALSSGMMAVIELTTPTTDPSPVTTGPPELPGWTGTVI